MSLSIGKASKFLGVSISTLRRWQSEGKLLPDYCTLGGHRCYSINSLLKVKSVATCERKTIAYARVSSHDQKADLVRQGDTLLRFCEQENNAEFISDLGSGMNMKKKGLLRLLKLLCQGEVGHLILTHKDRLLRFGADLIFRICDFFGTKVTILNEKIQTFEQELAADVLEIITVFSARLYGSRSHKNKRLD